MRVHETLHPASWKRPSGYANGIVAAGRTVYLGGQVGWNTDHVLETNELAGQAEQALRNIVAILDEAGAGPEHLVRLTWFVVDMREYLDGLKNLGKAYKRVIGKHYPAMSVVQVAALVVPGTRVEIEATAVLP